MKTLKIAGACLIGGVVCCGVALYATPQFWWLGILAGFAAGYLSYEFRTTLASVPHAGRSALRMVTTDVVNSYTWRKLVSEITCFFQKPHVFGYTAAKLLIIPYIWFTPTVWDVLFNQSFHHHHTFIVEVFGRAFIGGISYTAIIVGYVVLCHIMGGTFYFLALLGSRMNKQYWITHNTLALGWIGQSELADMQEDGYVELPLTAPNAYKWILLSFFFIFQCIVWYFWKFIALLIYYTLKFFVTFLSEFIVFIHKNERLLCGIDGTLGGTAAYIWLAPHAETMTAKIVVIACGGLLGTAFGVLNWEIVSKRILKVAPLSV